MAAEPGVQPKLVNHLKKRSRVRLNLTSGFLTPSIDTVSSDDRTRQTRGWSFTIILQSYQVLNIGRVTDRLFRGYFQSLLSITIKSLSAYRFLIVFLLNSTFQSKQQHFRWARGLTPAFNFVTWFCLWLGDVWNAIKNAASGNEFICRNPAFKPVLFNVRWKKKRYIKSLQSLGREIFWNAVLSKTTWNRRQ